MVKKYEELDVSRAESDAIKELMALLEVWITHLGYLTAQKLELSENYETLIIFLLLARQQSLNHISQIYSC